MDLEASLREVEHARRGRVRQDPISYESKAQQNTANNSQCRMIVISGRDALKYRDCEPSDAGANQQHAFERADFVSERPDVARLAEVKHKSVRRIEVGAVFTRRMPIAARDNLPADVQLVGRQETFS